MGGCFYGVKYSFDYLYDEESINEVKKYIKSYELNRPLIVEKINKGTILPRIKSKNKSTWMGLGGVLDNEGNFVELSAIKHVLSDGFAFGGSYDFDVNSTIKINKNVLYLGPIFNHWGHFLVDFITRLWYYIKVEKMEVAYCGWGFEAGHLHGTYKRFFDLLGIDAKEMIDVRSPISFSSIVVPEPCYLRNKYNTQEYKEIIDYVSKNIDNNGLIAHKKVYFTRSRFIKKSSKWHLEYGENAIEKTFEKNGFFVVDPSEISLDEQIFYVKSAKIFAGIASSNIIDTVFATENTDRIYIKKCYEMENEAPHIDYITKANDVILIDGFLLPYESYRPSIAIGPHLLGMNNLLKTFFRDRNMKTLSDNFYKIEKIKTYFWLFKVLIYRFLYKIYYCTIRDLFYTCNKKKICD